MTQERRFFKAAEVRVSPSGGIAGYAAVFNQLSEDLGGFRERILPGAFSRSLASADVRCLFNHNPEQILGRSKSGTLRLSEDRAGLYFDCDLPDTQLGRDLRTIIKRGDISECSFSFSAVGQNWIDGQDGKTIRELTDVDLFDVSPVTFAAYPQTSVSARQVTDPKMLFPDGVPAEVRGRKSTSRAGITPAQASRTPTPPARATIPVFKSDASRLSFVQSKLGIASTLGRTAMKHGLPMTDGGDAELRAILRGLTTDTAPELVPEWFNRMVLPAMRGYDPIFDPDVCTQIETDTGGPYDVFSVDDTQSEATILGEATADTEQDPVPYVAKLGNAPTWTTGPVKMSNALLTDSGVDSPAMLAKAFGIRLARGIGRAMIAEIIASVSPGVITSESNNFDYSELLRLRSSVDAAYRNSGRCWWLMNESTLNYIDNFKDMVGHPIIPQTYIGSQRILLGFPVGVSPSVPNFAEAGDVPILFGAMNYFVLRVVKGGGQLVRLSERYAEELSTGFKSFLRANGAMTAIVSYAGSPAVDLTPIQYLQMGTGS
jgi:HK97 family phage major capsid protein/HK97 family phage prohead protease